MSRLIQVNVTLLGRQFTIGTPAEERDTLVDAIRLLEEKVKTIQAQGRIAETDKIAIMAALNIAHDLLKTKIGEGLEIAEFQRKLRNMSEAADKALQHNP